MNKEKGFTLIEQMATIIIFSIAMVSILPVLVSSVLKIKNEDFQLRASTVGQEMIEAVREAPFSELNTGTYSGDSEPTPSTSSFAVSYRNFRDKVQDNSYLPNGSVSVIVANGPGTGIRQVSATVNWEQGSADKSFNTSTYVFDESQ